MKRLSKISARNFKGLSFDTQLAPATLLVGANFAGKTARTDAIRLLLLGHLPELGKNNKDSMGLASGREMAVEGTFEDNTFANRIYKMKGDSVSCEKNMPPAIADCDLLAVMLNAESYFAMGDRARVEYVAANCPGEGLLTHEQVMHRVIQKTKYDWVTIKETGEDSVQDFIERSIQRITEEAKASRAYATRMEQTVQGLSALRAGDDADKAAANLAQVEARRGEIHAEARVLDERRAALKAEDDQRQRGRRRREQLEKELAAGGADGKRASLAAARVRLDHLAVPAEPAAETVASLRRMEMELNSELQSARSDYTAAASARAEASNRLAEADVLDKCPYCGATGEGWKDLRRSDMQAEIGKQEKAMEDARARGNEAKAKAAGVKEGLDAADRQRVDRRDALEVQGRMRREASDIEVSLARLAALEEELKGLPAAAPDDPTEMVAVGHRLSALQSDLNATEQQRKAALGRQHELGRLAQAEQDRDKAKAEAEAAVDAADELKLIQAEMVEAAFRPLLERANRIFGGVLRSPLAYRDGEIGTWRDGLWVGHRTFSGTEKALAYAAIQAALTSASPVRIMLLDELGRLDAENKRKTIRCALDAVERGDIDQFIGIDAGSAITACLALQDMIKADGTGLTVVQV